MRPPGFDWRSPRQPLMLAAAIVAGTLLTAAGAWLAGLHAPLRYASLPLVEGAVPVEPIDPPRQVAIFGLDSPMSPPPALRGPAEDPAAPRLDADRALLEWRDGLALPRIAEDGRRPLEAYARAAGPLADGHVEVAVVVVDLGLDAARLEQSVLLPGPISLAHTPYAAHLAGWQRHARWHGHEVVLELPLQAADYPSSDFGPWALAPDDPPAQQVADLQHIMGRSEAYVGLAGAGEAFAARPDDFRAIAAALAARGLGFIELGDDNLAAPAAAVGLGYASAMGPLDAVPEAAAIDAELGRLETEALRSGRALGFAQPYPLTFDRLWHWARGLEGRGITLVPASRMLLAE